MQPTYCSYHQHFTDGPCQAGRRSLTRHDLFIRIKDIDALLDDDEGAQSRGYVANLALQAEKAQLQVLLNALNGGQP